MSCGAAIEKHRSAATLLQRRNRGAELCIVFYCGSSTAVPQLSPRPQLERFYTLPFFGVFSLWLTKHVKLQNFDFTLGGWLGWWNTQKISIQAITRLCHYLIICIVFITSYGTFLYISLYMSPMTGLTNLSCQTEVVITGWTPTLDSWDGSPNLRRFRVMHRFAPPIRYR